LIYSNYDSNNDEKPEAIIYEKYMKLKFSVWEHIEFLSETVGLEDPQLIFHMIREQVEESFVKYSPTFEFSEEQYEV
jgi:hypothetical protein